MKHNRAIAFFMVIILILICMLNISAVAELSRGRVWSNCDVVYAGEYSNSSIGYLSSGERIIYSWDLYFKNVTINFSIRNNDTGEEYHKKIGVTSGSGELIITVNGTYELIFYNPDPDNDAFPMELEYEWGDSVDDVPGFELFGVFLLIVLSAVAIHWMKHKRNKKL